MNRIKGTVPCSVCGEYPILQGGKESAGRLVCPNYKSTKIQHGNLSVDTKGIPRGFTPWCHYFWNEEQGIKIGMPTIIEQWNNIHGIKE